MSVKGSIEALLRDKASTSLIALYLLWDSMQDVTTDHELLRFFALVILVLGIIYENHRHVERTGKYARGLDLMRELRDWMTEEMKRNEREQDEEGEGTGGPIEGPTETSGGDPPSTGPEYPPPG